MADDATEIVGFRPGFLKIPSGMPPVVGLQKALLARILKEIDERAGQHSISENHYYLNKDKNQFPDEAFIFS